MRLRWDLDETSGQYLIETLQNWNFQKSPLACIIIFFTVVMEQQALKNVNNSLYTNIYSYSETAGGQSSSVMLISLSFPDLNLSLQNLQQRVSLLERNLAPYTVPPPQPQPVPLTYGALPTQNFQAKAAPTVTSNGTKHLSSLFFQLLLFLMSGRVW